MSAPISVASAGPAADELAPVASARLADGRLAIVNAEGRLRLWRDAHESTDALQVECGGIAVTAHPALPVVCVSGPQGWALADLGAAGGPAPPEPAVVIAADQGSWSACARWSPDGQIVAVGADRWVVLLDPTGVEVARIGPLASTVTDCTWSRDGAILCAASYGGVTIAHKRDGSWPADAVDLREFTGSLLCLALSPSSDWLVSGNQDRSLQVYRLSEDTRLEMAGFTRKVTCAQFDTSGRWVANNGAAEVTVWDFSGAGPRGSRPFLLDDHQPTATCLAWHPARTGILATGDGRGLVRTWDVVDGRPGRPLRALRTPVVATGAAVRGLHWHPTGGDLWAVHADGSVHRSRGIR